MSDSEKQKHEAADSEEQKRVDLARAQHRTLKRPGKKEKRFSEIDGRYVPPPELQKEIDKLVEAKAQAAQKKKGLLKLFKRDAPPLSAEEKNKEIAEKKTADSSNPRIARDAKTDGRRRPQGGGCGFDSGRGRFAKRFRARTQTVVVFENSVFAEL